MKKIGVLAAALAMVCLCVGVASAEMYVEGYIGGAFSNSLSQTVNVSTFQPGPFLGSQAHYNWAGNVSPSVLGGVKVGTWFVKEGTLGWNGYPDWAKYLGFYTDFGFQRLYTSDQRLSGTNLLSAQVAIGGVPAGGSTALHDLGFLKTEGSIATWAFMFAGRYGFFPDSEVPFGRLQPYVAVGPAIMFSSMKPKISTTAVGGPPFFNGFENTQISPGSQSSTNIALAVDAGVRYMCLKNVSIDLSFKYRYAQPTYDFAGQDNIQAVGNVVPAHFTLSPNINLYSIQVGAAYHF